MKVQGEEVFSVPTERFAISPSNEGYTLNYSADGVNFTAIDEATPANEVGVFVDAPKGMSYKLVGNNSTVYTQY
jgi:hypothetical protein